MTRPAPGVRLTRVAVHPMRSTTVRVVPTVPGVVRTGDAMHVER